MRQPVVPLERPVSVTERADNGAVEAVNRVESDVLRSLESEALKLRQEMAGLPVSTRYVGLALSGGGVRSATFALGLLRGLAKNGLLTHLDYLSTVSGGGYIGAMFGRLVMANDGIKDAQSELARVDSRALAWLRRNGRYLNPAGSGDLAIGVVTYLRAMLAIHLESFLAALLLAALITLPHVAQPYIARVRTEDWMGWYTLWWPLASALALICMPFTLAGFWTAREPSSVAAVRSGSVRDVLLAIVVLAALVGVTPGLLEYVRCAFSTIPAYADTEKLHHCSQGGAPYLVGGWLAMLTLLAGIAFTRFKLLRVTPSAIPIFLMSRRAISSSMRRSGRATNGSAKTSDARSIETG